MTFHLMQKTNWQSITFFYNKLKGEFMFDKYLNLNKDNITEEQKKEAYEQIKIYAKENNTQPH